MVIIKILNNNAVICLEKDEEIIVRGKGISFQKECGDILDESKIEKIYRLDNHTRSKFEELIANVDFSYIDISEEIVHYAILTYKINLNDIVYISLADHLSYTIERTKEGILVTNPLLIEIRRYYPDEYSVGLYAIELIKEKYGIKLPDDEAGFIAWHIANAQVGNDKQIAYQTTRFIQNILNIIRLRFNVIFDQDSIYYYRFITHLKFLAQRLFLKQIHSDTQENEELFKTIKAQYPKTFECSEYIKTYIANNYKYSLTKDEQLYLTIHIQRIINKSKKGDDNE